MIVKRLKKLWQLWILICVRQVYFLGRNIYNLYYRPYLTLKKIKDEEDKSQILLISLTALTPLYFYVILRVTYDLLKYGRIVLVTGNVFTAAIGIQAILLGYLLYWTLMVLRKS